MDDLDRQYVIGVAMMVIGCCGNGPWWLNFGVGLIGCVLVWRSDK